MSNEKPTFRSTSPYRKLTPRMAASATMATYTRFERPSLARHEQEQSEQHAPMAQLPMQEPRQAPMTACWSARKEAAGLAFRVENVGRVQSSIYLLDLCFSKQTLDKWQLWILLRIRVWCVDSFFTPHTVDYLPSRGHTHTEPPTG